MKNWGRSEGGANDGRCGWKTVDGGGGRGTSDPDRGLNFLGVHG